MFQTAPKPPAKPVANRREFFRVDTQVHLVSRPLPKGRAAGSSRAARGELLAASQSLLDALKDLRVQLDPKERLVAERVQRFVVAATAALEEMDRALHGDEASQLVPANVSGGGISISTSEGSAPGDRFELVFRLAEVAVAQEFRMTGEVVACRPIDLGGRFRLHLKFVEVDEAARERLIAQLFEIQRLQRRNAL